MPFLPFEQPPRILISLPDALRSEGVASLLRDRAGEMRLRVCAKRELLALADPGAGALDAVIVAHPWISIATLRSLHRRQPECALIACCRNGDVAEHRMLLAAGVAAIVPDDAPPDVIALALQVTLVGSVSIHARDLRQCTSAPTERTRGTQRIRELNLTSRQLDVLRLIAASCPNKAIASELGIGVRTVKGHVAVILRALHADSRREAARRARQWLGRQAVPIGSRSAYRRSTGFSDTETAIR